MKIENWKLKINRGFTLIELLIVITLLGILAVAVLSAINPIEQINRSKDTATRSDAEQLINAISRFYANKGYYPWVESPGDDTDANDFDTATEIGADAPEVVSLNGCSLVEMLSSGDNSVSGCVGTQEIKLSFVNRIAKTTTGGALVRPLYIYYDTDVAGSSVYICFEPQSAQFENDANDRCADLPSDLVPSAINCDDSDPSTTLSCLP